MNVRDTRYKLQKLNMSLRNADMHQFQPRLRALTDFLSGNTHCTEFIDKLDKNDPIYDEWSKALMTTGVVNLDFSEEQRASLGYQAIVSDHDGSDLIGLTHWFTSSRQINGHVRAFYDTFIEPFCDWLGEQLESLESNGSPTENHNVISNIVPKEKIEQSLSFIKKEKLKEILVRDLFDAQQVSSHKSVVVLCGGSVEAILIYKLSQGGRKTRAITAFRTAYPKATHSSDLDSWSFEQLIFIAKQLKLIDAGLRSALDSIRNFRNFVHPYRELSSPSSPDKHMANIALSSAFHLLDLDK